MAVANLDTLRTKAFGSITGSYTTVGTPTQFNFRIFRIINNTDADMFFSIDGTNDQLYVPATSFVLYDLSTNAPPINVSDNFVLAVKTQFYVRYSSAPTSGSVAIEGIYARGV